MSSQTPGVVMVNVARPGEPANYRPFRKKIRNYAVNITRSAVASAQFTGVIQINPTEYPFLMQSIHANDSADGNALTSQVDMFIGAVDNESGYQWTDGVIPRASLAGDRVFGYQFPEEVPIRANTRVTFTVQNPSAAPAAGTLTITLRGWELWPLS